VAIPAPGGLATAARWQLKCPQGVVGGVDAKASSKAVAVEFPGLLGSPVNPGISTGESLVFRGTYTGRDRAVAGYQPFIGCIPTAGGGPRTRTSFQATAEVVPGQSITVRTKAMLVTQGSLARATLGCKPGERLLGSGHSVGIYMDAMPTKVQLAAVKVIRARRGNQILVSATRRGLLPHSVRAEVQIQAECAA
jgi:hypothetical protein